MSPKGKYFFIKSQSSGLYLDVKGASSSPHTPVILWGKTGNDNQIWYHDALTRTIRSKQSNLCLDINGDRLCINDYQQSEDQQLIYHPDSQMIRNVQQSSRVLDVVGDQKDPGAEVCIYGEHGRDNQKWELEFCPVQYFFIRSATCDKVLDISGASKSAGAKVILYKRKSGGSDNQLWYEDLFGNIRSKLNDKLCLDGTSGVLHTGHFVLGNNRTFWAVEGNIIRSAYSPNEVLDLKGGSTDDGTEICVWNYHGNANQQWHLDYHN